MLYLDFETYSEADLKICGAYAYARHPSTRTLCLAMVYKKEEIILYPGDPIPKKWQRYLNSSKIRKTSHNCLFEYWIYKFVFVSEQKKLKIYLKPLELSVLYDSMASTAYYGYALGLENAALELNLSQIKYAAGRMAMLQLCKPQRNKIADYDKKLIECGKYCLGDVHISKKIVEKLGEIDNDFEMDIFYDSLQMNDRGIPIDIQSVRILLTAFYWFQDNVDTLVRKVTKGKLDSSDLRSHIKLREYLSSKKYPLPNIQIGTVQNVLKTCRNSEVKKVLALRISLGKASVKKLIQMEAMSKGDPHYRARGAIQYYGAHTGRDTGRNFQPLNLPKDTMTDIELKGFLALCKRLPFKKAPSMADLKILDDMPRTIRRLIKAEKGNTLTWGDYAQIEARVLAWLSGDKTLVNDFLNSPANSDVYCILASKIFKRVVTKKNKSDREIGKRGVLGLGFQMGAERFKDDVLDKTGIVISARLADETVKAYRLRYARVPGFWKLVQQLFYTAMIRKPKKAYELQLGHAGISLFFGWSKKVKGVYITLPSGRSLYYPNSKMGTEIKAYGDRMSARPVMGYKDGTLYGGKICENIVQAVARDIMTVARMSMNGVIFSVYDEIVLEHKKKNIRPQMHKKMVSLAVPSWYPTEMVAVETFSGTRYDK